MTIYRLYVVEIFPQTEFAILLLSSQLTGFTKKVTKAVLRHSQLLTTRELARKTGVQRSLWFTQIIHYIHVRSWNLTWKNWLSIAAKLWNRTIGFSNDWYPLYPTCPLQISRWWWPSSWPRKILSDASQMMTVRRENRMRLSSSLALCNKELSTIAYCTIAIPRLSPVLYSPK